MYQPPPGIVNEAAQKGAQFQSTLTTTNESSLRIQTGNLPLYHRAEAFFRFPPGPQYFMAFQRLNVWGRGRGNGWGQSGELQMYIKVGRDENNFYMFRAPANAGPTAAAWTDFAIDLSKFIDLRKKIQTAYLAGKHVVDRLHRRRFGDHRGVAAAGGRRVAPLCRVPGRLHGVHARSGGHRAEFERRARDGGRHRARGVRRLAGAPAISPSDTLELWVDDVRLDRQLNTGGTAGAVSARLNMGELRRRRGDDRVTAIRISGSSANSRRSRWSATSTSGRRSDWSGCCRASAGIAAAAHDHEALFGRGSALPRRRRTSRGREFRGYASRGTT